ncbi:helix-turn-helix transcriptional regulator [Marispirochaeta sp.]|uniref:response regulator transcription factor n=1 Tax=Marispirochaeta sp. TaxID=2038653 RepID=UPI0029C91D4C|nr:helix-turn-helix transcriptional regulator [Marispirochaeta sp.]
MKHFYLLLNFFSFAIGVTALAVSFFLFSKYRLKVYKKYFIFLAIFTIIYILDLMDFYFSAFLIFYNTQIKLVLISIKTIFSVVIIYSIADLFFMIIHRPLTNVLKKTLIVIIFLLLSGILGLNFFISDIEIKILCIQYLFISLMVARILLIITALIQGWPLYKNVESLELLFFFRSLFLMTGLVLFLNVIGGTGYYLALLDKRFLSMNGHSIVYLVWNLVSLIFVYWYFIHRIDAFRAKGKLDIMASQYKITKREKEIILLVSQGYSNKDICNKLFISMSTTKTHLRNIFEKTDIKSRFDLLQLLKD